VVFHQRMQRHVILRLFSLQRILESGRHHANDSVGTQRKRDLFADDFRIAIEEALPGRMAKDHHTWNGVVVFTREDAAECRFDIEDWKDIGSNSESTQFTRFLVAAQNRARARKGSETTQRSRLIAKVSEVGEGIGLKIIT